MKNLTAKEIESKLNILNAQIDAFQNSGLFYGRELEKLIKPIIKEIEILKSRKEI